MKFEGWLFMGGTFIFGPIAFIYYELAHEPVGVTALALTGGLSFLVGFYLLFTGKRVGERPEDREDGEIAEGAGDLGFYSPHSWSPLAVAFSAFLAFLGLVFGWWLFAIGAGLGILALIGWVFEYYRGDHAHTVVP